MLFELKYLQMKYVIGCNRQSAVFEWEQPKPTIFKLLNSGKRNSFD